MTAARMHDRPGRGVDVALRGIAGRFSLLLLCTPVDTRTAWSEYRAAGGADEPRFRYAPIDLDIPDLYARLDAIDFSRVEDPDVASLLHDEADAIRTRLDMIAGRGTPRFLEGSIRLHGTVDDDLLGRAESILAALDELPPAPAPGWKLDALGFRDRALAEIEHYRRACALDIGGCRIDEDVSGPVVVHGELRIPPEFHASPRRAEAIIAHEIGTHVVTFINGSAQPLHLLETGLRGADALQEGLAVIAEYLVGGLTPARMRTIAARVIAVRSMLDGASFVEIERLMRARVGLAPYPAFFGAMRVCRAGGFTKDAAYLRGLVALLRFYRQGEADDVLFTGKLGFEHIDTVRRLLARGVLVPPVVKPRHVVDPAYASRRWALRRGIDVTEMIEARST